MGTLYVVATPIGNLEDVTLRALRVLKEVDVVLAEDTRTAKVLLDRYGIKRRLLSYTDHNKSQRIPEVLRLLEDQNAALVSDAGTPAISDPGVELVAAARGAGNNVVAVPGASAVAAALSVAGLPTRSYRFLGFLPRQPGALRRLFQALLEDESTIVAFESPARLPRTLSRLAEVMSGRRVAVCRELTKLHEEVFVGTAAEARERFAAARGEVVLVIEGASKGATPASDEAGLRAEIEQMRRLGLTRAQATALLGERYHASRRRLYDLWLEL